MKSYKERQRRLKRFAKKYVTGKEGGEPFGNFMSIEGYLDNAETDVELLKYGFYE